MFIAVSIPFGSVQLYIVAKGVNLFRRYCSQGNKRCPISGGNLKMSKSGKVVSTVDFNLRKLIIKQAAQAKV